MQYFTKYLISQYRIECSSSNNSIYDGKYSPSISFKEYQVT